MLLSHGGSSRGISCYSLHTDCRGGHGLFTRMVLVPNLRIVEFFFTRRITEVTVFLSRIIELSNWFFFTRRIAESHGVLSRDLSFGPTDQREVIIVFLSSHGESRRVTGVCHELSNCRISFHTESHGGFLCHETCSWSRICELVFFTRNVADGCGGYEGGTIEA